MFTCPAKLCLRMLLASAIPRRSLAQATAATISASRARSSARNNERPAAMVHDRIDASEACPSRWEPLDSLAVDLDIDILTVLAAPAVDHIEGPSAQRMERVVTCA